MSDHAENWKTIPEAVQGAQDAAPAGRENPQSNNADRKMIARVDEIWNKDKRRYESRRTRPVKPNDYKFTKYVLVVRRHFNKDGAEKGSKVDIRGPRLQKALQRLNEKTVGFGFQDNPPKIDPRVLYHSYTGLMSELSEAERSSPFDSETCFELRAATTYIEEDFAETFSSLRTLLPKLQIDFWSLWTLYPPNTIVYATDALGYLRAYLVRVSDYSKDDNDIPFLFLQTDYIDSDGKNIGWVKGHVLRIYIFYGVKDIIELLYVPLTVDRGETRVREILIEKGKAAMKRHGRHVVEYKGLALRRSGDKWVRFNPHGRVVLDPESWKKTKPDHAIPSLDKISQKSVEDDEEKIMLVNTMVYGFSLGDKTWGMFSATQTADAKWNADAFGSLVLDPDVKDFAHDLVSSHRAHEDESFDDFISTKGRGLVGLLSGSAGVGKTLTAEAIAEVTKRPLYVISSGELGSKPTDIHEKLTAIFELAELWDAVVLLDEADVFLGARDSLDFQRNAIVSIFLRELEYYQGIIILTTNQATMIDLAFHSRIHFSLNYPDLDAESQLAIWRTFVDRARDTKRLKIDIDENGMNELAGLKLNGRQIKNAMSVAQRVAVKREQTLTVALIRTALRLSQWAALQQEHPGRDLDVKPNSSVLPPREDTLHSQIGVV